MLKSLGPYDLLKVIGRGGMGTVFLGIHRETDNRVAIKVLAPAYASDPGFRERFEAEIQSLEKLKHPHIVELFGYGEENGTLYYVMELVEGTNLQQELRDGCRFSWREVIDIGIAICAALKQAHDHGIIHRDIKPANLLLTTDHRIKLSDFGIAKLFGNTQITADGGVLGTADYMAPEQAEGIGATVRSDLYSLGGVLYCLLAGRPPFQGKSMAEVVHKVRYDDVIPVRRFASETPEALEAVITKLLNKTPGNRVPTARALSNRLKAIRHALSLKVEEDNDPELLDMGPDTAASRASRKSQLDEEDFADLETAVELAAHPDDMADPMSVGIDRAAEPLTANARDEIGDQDIERRTHFTAVDDEHRRRRLLPDDSPPETPWAKFASIVCISGLLCLLLAITWKLRQPLNADRLHERITEIQEKGPDALVRGESKVVEFLERFPDDERAEHVAELHEDIELARLARQLATRPLSKNRPLAPVERALFDAIRKEPLNPVTAASELQAIIDLFATDPEATEVEKKCIQLAIRNLKSINERLQNNNSTHVSVIQSRLDHANGLMQANPKEGERMIRSIIVLYADKPWASDLVQKAREILREAETSETTISETEDPPSST